jgi:hypothetical protein
MSLRDLLLRLSKPVHRVLIYFYITYTRIDFGLHYFKINLYDNTVGHVVVCVCCGRGCRGSLQFLQIFDK